MKSRADPAADRSGTIDLDGTDVEVYGPKDGIAYCSKGARAGRPHVATWAEAGLVVAADLPAGDEDPRPGAQLTASQGFWSEGRGA